VAWSHSLYFEYHHGGLWKEVRQVSVRGKAEVLVVDGISRGKDMFHVPWPDLVRFKERNETAQSPTTQWSYVG